METKHTDGKNKIVIYTDGSFLHNSDSFTDGFYGSGVHGYIYHESTIGQEPKLSDRPDGFKITTNGYVKEHDIKLIKDIQYVNPFMYIDASYSYYNSGNNVISELEAVTNVLTDIYEKICGDYKVDEILICTDSKYVIYCIDLITSKKKTDWDNDEQKNRDKIKDLNNIYIGLKSINVNIRYLKVEAHSGLLGNELADRLAYYGRQQSIERNINKWFFLSEPKNYWNVDERHPLLRYRQLFFTNSLKAPSDKIIYSVMDYSTTTEPGKKTHDACFGLIMLNQYQNLIEDAISTYHKLGYMLGRMSSVSTINLNSLYHKNTLRYYNMFGNKSFSFSPKLSELRSFTNVPLIYTINPSGLALQALEKMQVLNNIVKEFENGHKKTKIRTFFNITNQFYDISINKKGNKVFNTIPANGINQYQVDITIDDRKINLLLDLGKDTLSRNQLKALEKEEPEIWLVVDNEPCNVPTTLIYRYYTIVKTKSGDVGIFCNFYSGLQLIDTKKEKKK